MITLLGILLPRLIIAWWWVNDPSRWSAVFDGPLLPALGFVFLPWTTLWYVFFEPTGFDLFAIILLVGSLMADLGTWGIGAFANKDRATSIYRDL